MVYWKSLNIIFSTYETEGSSVAQNVKLCCIPKIDSSENVKYFELWSIKCGSCCCWRIDMSVFLKELVCYYLTHYHTDILVYKDISNVNYCEIEYELRFVTYY